MAFKSSCVHNEETKAKTGAAGRCCCIQGPEQGPLQPVGGVCCLPSTVKINYRFEKGYSNLRAGFEASGEFERFVLVKECLRSLSIPHTDHNSREALLGVHRSNQEHIIITNHTP